MAGIFSRKYNKNKHVVITAAPPSVTLSPDVGGSQNEAKTIKITAEQKKFN